MKINIDKKMILFLILLMKRLLFHSSRSQITHSMTTKKCRSNYSEKPKRIIGNSRISSSSDEHALKTNLWAKHYPSNYKRPQKSNTCISLKNYSMEL